MNSLVEIITNALEVLAITAGAAYMIHFMLPISIFAAVVIVIVMTILLGLYIRSRKKVSR